MSKLIIPENVLDQHLVMLGKTGAGKSSALRHIVEHLLTRGKRVCVIDPKGDWFGLKVGADGHSPGFPVIMFGDFKEPKAQDVPINKLSGPHVADLIATGNRPAVVGLRGWHTADMHTFWEGFASTLFAKNIGELYVVGDEFHNFAPKGKVLSPQAGISLHWSNRLLSEGRGLGLVCLIASQRPQKVHNDTLTSCETLVAMRVVHAADRNAVKDWVDGAGDPEKGKEVLASLAALDRGEGWVWSPEVGFGPKRVKFPMFTTFDSFAPPQLQKKVTAAGWADVNLDQVKEKLAKVIEEAKANDPIHLRKEVADLRRQLAAKAPAAPAEVKTVEKPVVTDKQVSEIEGIISRLEKEGQKRIEAAESLRTSGEQLVETGNKFAAALRTASAPVATPSRAMPARVAPAPAARPMAAPRAAAACPSGDVLGRKQRFLDAAAALTTLGVEVSRDTVAAWVGVHPRGGSVGEELKSLAEAGLITVDRGQIAVTDAGMAQAEPVDPAGAVERAKAGLSPRQVKIFDLVTAAYPGDTTREAVAEAMGIHPRGGSLGEDITRLKGRGLIDSARGVLRARDFLFAGSA